MYGGGHLFVYVFDSVKPSLNISGHHSFINRFMAIVCRVLSIVILRSQIDKQNTCFDLNFSVISFDILANLLHIYNWI